MASESPQTDQWLLLFDTCSLMNIMESKRSINSIFKKDNCQVVIPHHVLAELDKFSKSHYRRGPKTQDTPYTKNDEDLLDARDSERNVELARRVAREIAEILPLHLNQRLLSFEDYNVAKSEAEKIQIDFSQRSMEADNRILVFARKVVEMVGDKAKVLFVTDDNIMFIATCFQFGSKTVSRSKDWEKAVWPKKAPLPLSSLPPTSGHSDQSVEASVGEAAPTENLSIQDKIINRHIAVLASVSDYEIDNKLKMWEALGISLQDRQLTAYFLFDERMKGSSKVSCCTRWNSPADTCQFEAYNGKPCAFEHKCLFCGDTNHGWYNYDKCRKFQELDEALQQRMMTEKDQWDRARNKVPESKPYVPVPPEMLPTLPAESHNGTQPIAGPEPMKPLFAEKARTVQKPSSDVPKIILKVDTMPHSKTEVDQLFITHPKHEKLKPVLAHIKRLAFGKEQDDSAVDAFNRTFGRYLIYQTKFCCVKVCHFFNRSHGCLNDECNHEHMCLFCDSDKHGWHMCPNRQKLEDLITSLHFDIPSVQVCESPFEVIEQLVNAYGSSKTGDKKDATEKLIKAMTSVSKEKIAAHTQDYMSKKFFIPLFCRDEFVARMIISFNEKKFACINFNSHYCAGKKPCPHKHICTHCGDTSHGWVVCEERLNQCLEVKSLGFSQERLWQIIEERAKK